MLPFSDISNCNCAKCVPPASVGMDTTPVPIEVAPGPMDVDQDNPKPSIPVVSPNTLQRQSEEIRRCGKYSPAAILHAAKMTHHEFDNLAAKKVHKMLMEDPDIAHKILELLSRF